MLSCVWGLRRARRMALTVCGIAVSIVGWHGVARSGDLGPIGPEGPTMREQEWIVAGADPSVPLRATVFQPGREPARPDRPHPLVVINHGTNASTRTTMGRPVFTALSRWFVERGFVVLLPQRRGHGKTGGPFVEGFDRCARTDHYGRGLAAASDIEASIEYMKSQTFVDGSLIIVAGTSSGGWASLALASRNIPGVRLILNFSGGRGGHAYGQPNLVCQSESLVEAAGRFALAARVPTVWYYSRNDSYFSPDLASALARTWKANGGNVALELLPSLGTEGHFIMSNAGSMKYWERGLDERIAALVAAHGRHAPSKTVALPRPDLQNIAGIAMRHAAPDAHVRPPVEPTQFRASPSIRPSD